MTDSSTYWEQRYLSGRNSGDGSYGRLAAFKAQVINAFVAKQAVRSVIEFGCGDGNQLSLAEYPAYIGYDVSPTAIAQCRARFADDATKAFHPYAGHDGETAELTLSLDVIFHLTEHDVFADHMKTLFAAAERFAIVYSSDHEEDWSEIAPHVRHHNFSAWIAKNRPDFELVERIANPWPFEMGRSGTSFADFFIYRRVV